MEHVITTGERTKACHFCGAPIEAAHAREGDCYCCEGCYLKQGVFQAARETTQQTMDALVETLVAALDAREHETGLHSKRVACHTLVLARRFTDDEAQLKQIYYGALLHDIGKIGIPDAILLKHGSLTDDEWVVMRTHPEKGHAILQGVPFLREAAGIVLTHEERYDGTGYPRGLRGEAIPWGARLFAVIDALDAMTTDRPYRPAQSFDAARVEILRVAGSQFDPQACQAFDAERKVLREMVALKCGEAALPPVLANIV
jgi:HD-GYP domain-containing protein (c-di-GMP phosphodiesterase class II)